MTNIIKGALVNQNEVDAYFHGTSKRIYENMKLDEGTLVDVYQGYAVNVYVYLKDHLYQLDMEPEYLFTVERLEDGDWNPIEGFGSDPYEMIEHDALQEGDIIRFVDSRTNEILPYIPELDICDMSGVFMIARSLDDIESEMLDKVGEVINESDDDENDEDDNYTIDDISIVPATPIIEYLKRYGSMIQTAANAIDDMEAEYDNE